jgi:hypothetical protein
VGGKSGQRLLAFCRFLGVLGRMRPDLVQLMNCLTFEMPSPITLSMPDSAEGRQNLACLPFKWRDRRRTPNSAWRFHTSVPL